MQDNIVLKVFFVEILVHFNGFVMILSSCNNIFSFMLLCRKFGIFKKSWLCKTNDILQVLFDISLGNMSQGSLTTKHPIYILLFI